MNLLDLLAILVFALSILFCMHRGFLVSAAKGISFFISWLLAYLFYPLFSALLRTPGIISAFSSYLEGANKLGTSMMEIASTPVAGISSQTINSFLDKSSILFPYNNLIKSNIASQAFANQGLTTMGQYCDRTMALVSINILAFVILFVIIRLICGFVVDIYDHSHSLPVLKQQDTLLAGVIGLLQGFLLCYCVFALTPIILSILDNAVMTDYVTQSTLGNFFYRFNFILSLIRGT